MSDEIKDGGPAFPFPAFRRVHQGMALRDWFAGQAINGILANTELDHSLSAMASDAYRVADAMLKAREPKP